MTSQQVPDGSIYADMTYRTFLNFDPEQSATFWAVMQYEGYDLVPIGTLQTDIQDTDEMLSGGRKWESKGETVKRGLSYSFTKLSLDNYIFRRPVSAVRLGAPVKSTAVTAPVKTKEQIEHEKMMRFFFSCAPSDPSNLPPPPRVMGRTWDELEDY